MRPCGSILVLLLVALISRGKIYLRLYRKQSREHTFTNVFKVATFSRTVKMITT